MIGPLKLRAQLAGMREMVMSENLTAAFKSSLLDEAHDRRAVLQERR